MACSVPAATLLKAISVQLLSGHSSRRLIFSLLAAFTCAAPCAFAQNVPPNAPVITEPREGRVINPSDLHMETGPFVDANVGDLHRCTDWEVWTVTPSQRVWATLCIGGVERVHTHLGDGTFQNSHAGRRTLFPNTQYVLRVRHRDNSNVAATEWSTWAERPLVTGDAASVFAMELDDILTVPAPTLKLTNGVDVTLPVGSELRLAGLETGSLLELRGQVGGNQIVNPPARAAHSAVVVTFTAGAEQLVMNESDLVFSDHDGEILTIYLPAVNIAAGASASYWVGNNGATYVASAGQMQPSFAVLARGASVPWTTTSDVRVEIVATGFQLPVNIVFVPNPGALPTSPLYYVVELYGSIKVVRRDGVVSDYATGLLNFNPTGNFPGSGEQGLACAAVDPANGDLYITLVYSSIPGVESAPHYPAVERLTSTDGGLTMATRTRVLNLAPETQGQSHQISKITFGPEGLLYVHVGDGFDAAAATNLNFARGKILRMNGAGQPAPTNPYFSMIDGITVRDYIFASGVRNPFGGAWRLSDSALYFVENGPSVDRFARLSRGFNFGYNGSDESMTIGALYNWAPSTAPVNIAFVQPEIFGGSGFPAAYHGRAYITQSGATYGVGPGNPREKSITEWIVNAQGVLVSGPRAVAYYNGAGASSAVALAAGPDGLYFSDFYAENVTNNPVARGSSILRMRYVAPPPPPDCNNNQVPDGDDLAAGTSSDCDSNGVPDECDLSSGRSSDCNLNGVLDNCEVTVEEVALFDSGPAPFTLNGNAAWVGGAIRLTTTGNTLLGSMVRAPLSSTPMTSLTASFDLRIGAGSGADGASFAMFDAARYPVTAQFGEEGPGSQNESPGGPGTLVVQFDTYNNFPGGVSEGNNTIEVAHNGVTLGRFTPPFSLIDNQTRRVQVIFDGEHITVRMSNNQEILTIVDRLDVPNYVPFVALLGFGARTGGLTNEHWIDRVSFGVAGPNDLNANGIPDECECVADYDGNGGVEGPDVEAFYIDWAASVPRADVNFDGGVDGGDVELFFVQWAAGGC